MNGKYILKSCNNLYNNVSLKNPIKNLSIGVNEKLKDAIDKSIKDFKATLFIENIEMEVIDKDYEIYNIELEKEK